MKAEDIAEKLTDRLSQIQIANGYATDIGLRVFRGKRNLDVSSLPCVTIIEGDDSVQGDSLRSVLIDQHYSIEGHDVCDPNHPNDKAHLIVRDIKRALFGADTTLDRTIKKLHYRGRGISPREDGQALIAAAVLIGAQYVEDLTDP